jgi:PAS domain S-box-containing protein
MKILVAEDDAVSRRLLTITLAKWGYEVCVTVDGTEAWQALQAEDAPELAILDWMMPGIDGLELCRRLRARKESQPAYVILLTAKSRPEDIAAGLGAGADDYVTKPFERAELEARVKAGVRVVELQRNLVANVQELRDREERLRAILDYAKDGVVTLDERGIVRSFNPAAERIFGYIAADIIGRNVSTLLPEPHASDDGYLRTFLRASHANGADAYHEVAARRGDGASIALEVAISELVVGKARMFVGLVRDLSDRKRAEIELRHSQKLEAVGRLAAGIAHEINTPIQFIGDNTRFLAEGFAALLQLVKRYQALRDAAASGSVDAALLSAIGQAEKEADLAYVAEETPRAISQTLEGVDRVATIVRAMKDFAHPQAEEKTPADLNAALRSTLIVARNELKYAAEVETELGELPPVLCYLGDLNQVFLNLLVNAAHAIADKVGGSGEKGCIRVRTAQEEDSVVIAISDTGSGIAEEIRGKIFDPFFTTKEVGRGTGQGLAIARAIVVEKHGGTLDFETEPGHGTTFFIRLPVGGGPPMAAEAAA